MKTVEEVLVEALDQLYEKNPVKAEKVHKILKSSCATVEEQLAKLTEALQEGAVPAWRADKTVVEIRESLGEETRRVVKKNLGAGSSFRESDNGKSAHEQLVESFKLLGLNEAEARIAALDETSGAETQSERDSFYDQLLKEN